ncbi:prolactin-releasing peptide receptor isoform X2 [Balearica regulorum gibbericeps]|uniref:prolactin-releasing peptide receptor isoform X2 n=1 Tax=Balearica regulorum gibbericeps TaxID=100784 RepID=UPI003F634A6E
MEKKNLLKFNDFEALPFGQASSTFCFHLWSEGMISIQVGPCQLMKYVRDKPPAVRVHVVLPEEKEVFVLPGNMAKLTQVVEKKMVDVSTSHFVASVCLQITKVLTVEYS